VADTFYLRLVTRIMVLAIFAMSLDLLVGYTGLVSLGHAAFFGVGGYVAGALINHAGVSELALLLPASIGAAALVAVVIGWLSIRTSGIYFIMITLALAQMVFFFFHDLRFWGGADGLNIVSRPVLSWNGEELLSLRDRPTMYYAALAALVMVYGLLTVLLRSPFGRTLVGIRINEGRMRALGYAVQRTKLAAFVIAGAIAGLAGFLEASRAAFITPAHVNWHESGLVLVVVLLGGMGTLWGPILGAFALVFLEDFVSGLTERWLLVIGLFVIANVLFLPKGIAGLLEDGLRLLPRLKPSIQMGHGQPVEDSRG
jgi:branched-chain amino acid transport system permease protein